MRNLSRRFAASLSALYLFFTVFLIAAPVEAGLSIVNVLRGASPNGSIDGLIRFDGTFFTSANFGSVSNITRNAVTFFAAGTNGSPTGTNWSSVGASVDSSLGGYAGIDGLFFSEIYGASPVTFTVSNLNPSLVYVVQVLHGEPRACCAGNYADNEFVTDAGSIFPVPAFALGNSIAGENPPNYLDRAIVQVEVTGTSSLTYRMKDGGVRGPSIAGFQVRRISSYPFFGDGTTNLVDADMLVLNSPASAFVGNVGSNTRLIITNGAVLDDTYGYMAYEVTSTNNSVVVTGAGSRWTNVFELLVGRLGSFNSLLLTNGGRAEGSIGYIGFGSTASNNTVMVSGSNSAWVNRSNLFIGYSGSRGTLLIHNGGAVSNAFGWIGYDSFSDRNSVFVTGTNSIWFNRSNLVVGFDGSFSSLSVSNQATVQAANVTMGLGTGSSFSGVNRLTVDGGTLRATNVSRTAVLDVLRGTNVLNAGLIEVDRLLLTNSESFFDFNGGTLITRGASLNTINGLDFQMGTQTGRPPAVWNILSNATPTTITGGLLLGCPAANAAVFITNGASMSCGYLSIGFQSGTASNTFTISGPSSASSIGGFLAVGNSGQSHRLLITNGGAVQSFNGFIGFNSDADRNTATVSGPDSFWNAGFQITVGYSGASNNLVITDGASATNTLAYLGYFAGADANTATVGGPDSVWSTRSNLLVGASGSFNTLLVTNGGLVTARSGYIGNNADSRGNLVLVNGTNSSLILSNDLFVGWSGASNTLILTNGGQAQSTFGAIGHGLTGGTNTVLVTGTNSIWRSTTSFFVGYSASNNSLLITQGGVVTNFEGGIGFYAEAAGNRVTVAGPGSAWLNGDFTLVGSEGPRNSLVVTNGATVVATGMIIGERPSSTNNLLLVDAGELRLTNSIGNGPLDIRRGTNRFNAGAITADQVLVTNSLGRLLFNGGTLTTRSAAFANGLLLTVGNGSSAATYRMSGGVSNVHSFANGLNLAANATLAGNGTITGALTINNGATLAPGLSIGKIVLNTPPTLQGALALEIGKTGSALTNDQVQVVGALTYGGTLTVSHVGPNALAAGDSFPLFSASSYAGAFAALNLPSLSGGLTWTNRLLVDGSIAVVGGTVPQIVIVSLSGTNLVFGVTNGTPNGNWTLLTATNVTLPVSSWTTNRTGTFNSQGFVILTNGVTQSEPKRYFQIRTP